MAWDWIGALGEARRRGRPAVLVTLADAGGSTPRDAGAKMVVYGDGDFAGSIGGGRLEQLATEDARRCLVEGKNRVARYPLGAMAGQCCGGVAHVFFEVLNTGPRLYLFGAGHVGQALCRTLEGTPFRVELVDEREEWITHERLPESVARHAVEWDEFAREARWDAERVYVAVMTHRHDTDQAILEQVLRRPVRYVGLIGSRGKWARFRQRLSAKGFTEAELARVRCPIGISVGGKAPQEVAVSVAAELLQVHYGS